MRTIPALALVACLALAGCGEKPAPKYPALALSSGKALKILNVGTVAGPNGPALRLQYVSQAGFTDLDSLAKEADEVWASFQPAVVKANVDNVVLSANAVPGHGLMPTTQGYNFVYERDSTGVWKRRMGPS